MSTPRRRRVVILPPLAAIILIGCGIVESAAAQLQIGVGIPPQAYLVERIGGRHVAVQVLLRPGRNPHTFMPTPRQLVALGKVDLFFKIGLPLEGRLLEKLEARHSRPVVLDSARGIRKRVFAAGCCDHEHPHDGHQQHAGGVPDPHIWLSPPLLKVQAINIAEALQRRDPAHAADYRRNLAALLQEIDALHAKIGRMLKPCRGRAFYAFHPAFGYFGDAYGLEQKAVELEGHSPTPRQLRALVRQAKASGVKTIFVQPQFDTRSAQIIADALGGRVVPLDPLAKNVLANIANMATEIEQAVSTRADAG